MTTKLNRRKKIHARIRKTVHGTAQRPRLSVFRSNRDTYVQIIDDTKGHTLVAFDTRKLSNVNGTKVQKAYQLGTQIAKMALEKGITRIVFDRGGYLYHGRVKAVADGARAAGLQF